MELTKICTKCNIEKPATNEYFAKKKSGKYGLNSYCKECKNEYNSKYYTKNKETILEQKKEYHIQNRDRRLEYNKQHHWENRDRILKRMRNYNNETKEERSEYNKKYYRANKEKRLKYSKQYYEDNAVQISKQKKQYYEDNPDIAKLNAIIRRHKKKGLPCSLTLEQWERIKKDFNNKCCYCGEATDLEQEHFIALTKGGEYTHNNIIPACRKCNGSKYNKDFFEWYPKQEFYSKEREKKILKYLNCNDKGIQQLSIL